MWALGRRLWSFRRPCKPSGYSSDFRILRWRGVLLRVVHLENLLREVLREVLLESPKGQRAGDRQLDGGVI